MKSRGLNTQPIPRSVDYHGLEGNASSEVSLRCAIVDVQRVLKPSQRLLIYSQASCHLLY